MSNPVPSIVIKTASLAGLKSFIHLSTVLETVDSPVDLTKYVIYDQDALAAFGTFGEVHKAALVIGSDKGSICDTAEGLSYLHSQNIIHGDLTGKNVLINDQGVACIIDFGLSVIQVEFDATHYLTSNVGGAMRYRAPELMPGLSVETNELSTFKPKLTTACDIWSLGCVVLEILSGEMPYYNIPDVCLMLNILRGNIPDRPENPALNDEFWSYIKEMWGKSSYERPEVGEATRVLAYLRESALGKQSSNLPS
ncbi:hypothetical protein HWV62_17724 [Athelia sp. TMB]|nr:hypothetical protein HWV62_17724 [Athelia sp. TMB]